MYARGRSDWITNCLNEGGLIGEKYTRYGFEQAKSMTSWQSEEDATAGCMYVQIVFNP